jgi:general secretion pathway protein E
MVEMGSDPFIVADATRAILAQRLVRRLCPACSRKEAPPKSMLARAEELAGGRIEGAFRVPVGCPECGKLGYRRRTVIAEVLEVTPEIGGALRRRASVGEIRDLAVSQGMTTMAAHGLRRAAAGETTLEEVFRTLGLS